MKKLVSMVLTGAMVISMTVPAMASSYTAVDFQKLNSEDFNFTQAQQTRYTAAFMALSDTEYAAVIGELAAGSSDYGMLTERLELCGIKVGCIKKLTPESNAYAASQNVSVDNVTVIATATQRRQRTDWMVGGSVIFDKAETYPDTLDAAVIYFDSTKLSYDDYDLGITGAITLNSGKQATNGTLVFNYDDSKMKAHTVYTATALVTPTAAKGTRVNFGIDYVHSYSETTMVANGISLGVSFGGNGAVGGSVGVNLGIRTTEKSFQIADTGSFTI